MIYEYCVGRDGTGSYGLYRGEFLFDHYLDHEGNWVKDDLVEIYDGDIIAHYVDEKIVEKIIRGELSMKEAYFESF